MNKQFFGEATDKKRLIHVLNKETGDMLNDPDAVLEYVQRSFQEQAKPASGCAKTKDFTPNNGNRKYPWQHGAYSRIDPFTRETFAGKQGFGSKRDSKACLTSAKALQQHKSGVPDNGTGFIFKFCMLVDG